jgi:hypothetical protein
LWALLERLQVDVLAEVRAQLERGQQHRVLLGHRVHPAHHVVNGLQGGERIAPVNGDGLDFETRAFESQLSEFVWEVFEGTRKARWV